MEKKIIIILLSYVLCISACAETTHTSKRVITPTKRIEHHYILKVVDTKGLPVKGAQISYKLIEEPRDLKEQTVFTDQEGRAELIVIARPNVVVQPNGSVYYYGDKYISSVSYRILKNNYFMKKGEFKFKRGAASSNEICSAEKEIILVPYYTNNLPTDLRKRLPRFIQDIILESTVRDTLLIKKPIDIEIFKDKRYLKVNFIDLKTYNSIRVNKYQIGQMLFDDIIRKLLTHLNNELGDIKSLYGYELIISASTKNFLKDNSTVDWIQYRFFLPKYAVKQYKNMDITGQRLLDLSVILLDNERIGLKLQ